MDYFQGGEPSRPVASRIGYGGAVYGGKSYGLLGLAAVAANAFPGVQMAFFRRTYSRMTGPGSIMHDSREVFAGIGDFKDAGRHVNFPATAADFYFQHCEHETDVYAYHGKQFDILFLDEATEFTWPMIDYLLTRNRGTTDSILQPFAVMCSNPGQVGHAWYMQVFDLEEMQKKIAAGHYDEVLRVKNPSEKHMQTFFIPAFLEDNPIGLERDPEYPERLKETDADIYEALRHGDWDSFAGMAFKDFDRTRHVVPPFEIPLSWPRWRSVDPGFVHDWVCHFWARDPATGRVVVYRELAGSGLTSRAQCDLIAANSPMIEGISITFAGHDMWVRRNVDGLVKTQADEYFESGIPVIQADTDRVAGKKRLHGLMADLPDGKPGLLIFNTCPRLVSVLPKLSLSKTNPEDVEKIDGDDPYDSARYGTTNIDMFRSARKRRGSRQRRPSAWDSELL